MDRLFARSTTTEALQAELHRYDLLQEAATIRCARGADSSANRKRGGPISGRFGWIRAALPRLG